MSEQTKSAFLGDFGEYLVAWHLRSRYGVETIIYKGNGFDILCNDREGKLPLLLPTNQPAAISVKTRARGDNIDESVTADFQKTIEAAKAWNAIPYFAYVRICTKNGTIALFLLSVSKAQRYGKKFNVKKVGENSKIFEMNFKQYQDFWRDKDMLKA